MMRLHAVVMLFSDLDPGELSGWIERQWVRPEPAGDDYLFQEIDVARVRLVYDLRRAMAVEEETVPLVLYLLDQVFELRATITAISGALDAQPEAREVIRDALVKRH